MSMGKHGNVVAWHLQFCVGASLELGVMSLSSRSVEPDRVDPPEKPREKLFNQNHCSTV